MDFYLPEGNIVLFVDGGVWHADPRLFKPNDILFFGSRHQGRNGRSLLLKTNGERIEFTINT